MFDSNTLHNVMNTADGRRFVAELLLATGTDVTNGLPSVSTDPFEAGRKKIAVDLLSVLIYDHNEKFNLMVDETKRRNET